MRLSPQQVEAYHSRGYVVAPDLFTAEEIGVLKAELERFIDEPRPEVHMQRRGSEAPRLIYAADRYSEAFRRLSLHPRWIEPAKQLLGSDVYIHQLRINPKAPFDGESFWWHQDYGTWHLEDGMPTPRALMIAVYLDDVDATNGPLLVIPGSHRHGHVDEIQPDRNPGGYTVADIERPVIAKLAAEHGIEAMTFRAGSVMFMNCNLVHASPENLTPKRRTIVYLNANSVENAITRPVRATHHANRDFSPLVPLADDCLAALARGAAAAATSQ
jgi:ectoine hydroxylase